MTAGILQFFERTPSSLTKGRVQKSTRDQVVNKEKRALICKACGQVITTNEDRISINGQHIYTRINPAGIEYTFDCFRAAPGCWQVGASSYEHTWFAGHCWQISVCGGCGEHLGWYFRNGNAFFGLIENRLVEKQ